VVDARQFRTVKPPRRFNPTSPQCSQSLLRPGIRNLSKNFQLSAWDGKLNIVTCRFGPAGFSDPARLIRIMRPILLAFYHAALGKNWVATVLPFDAMSEKVKAPTIGERFAKDSPLTAALDSSCSASHYFRQNTCPTNPGQFLTWVWV